MKKITSIKEKGLNKYELVIDDKKHIIFGDVLLACGILKPQEIDSDTYMKMVNDNSFYEIYQKIVNYINYKKRCEKEVRDKLKTLAINHEVGEKVINKLSENGLLNDDDYLNSYINDQINLTLNGPFKIQYNLNKLGFNESIINQHLNIIDNSLWKDRVNTIIKKKQKTVHNVSKKRLIQKLQTDLKNLGYQDYLDLINNFSYSEEDNLKKDYEKYKNKLAKKYTGEQLEVQVKRKLYSLGYDVSNI